MHWYASARILWREGLGTDVIAEVLNLSEAEVYNHIGRWRHAIVDGRPQVHPGRSGGEAAIPRAEGNQPTHGLVGVLGGARLPDTSDAARAPQSHEPGEKG